MAGRRKIKLGPPTQAERDESQYAQSYTDRRNRMRAMCAALRKTGGCLYLALEMAKLPQRTHHDWMHRYPAYARRVALAKDKALDHIEFKGLIEPASQGNVRAAHIIMAAKGKDRGYGITQTELTGAGGGPIQVRGPSITEIAEKVPLGYLAALAARLAQRLKDSGESTLDADSPLVQAPERRASDREEEDDHYDDDEY